MSSADLIEPRSMSHDEIVAALSHPDALWEIVDGRVVEKPMGAFAVAIASRLLEMIGAECRRRGLGCWVTEMVFILDDQRKLRRRPDVAFVGSDRWPLDRTPPYRDDWAIAPTIAVEVVSPNNVVDEFARKRREYHRYGVQEVWIIYPEERIVEIYDGHGIREYTHEDRLTSPLLSEMEIELAPLLPIVDPLST